ncbi:hypothetical protein AVEN_104154-1 [Araneus ventricosus]|uniref:Uncharacterized protein n=1 Tax=Araneus ventricosus TaxID=182803 RepID=A0A4Y2M174_ARAVE|nr:hypothetical protein AVEN_104154-1 [Araneus ventricosus]
MRGIKKLSPLAMPVITVAGMTFSPRYVICNRAPLRSLGTSRLRINSSSTPTFNLSLTDDTPDNSKQFKNSTGYDFTCYYLLPYLDILQYLTVKIKQNIERLVH